MLIHKRTMGVIDKIWTGEYVQTETKKVPKEIEATFESVPGLRRDEWWEVKRRSLLGKALLSAYPWCLPVTDKNGNLTGIVALNTGEKDMTKNTDRCRPRRHWGGIITHLKRENNTDMKR